MAAEPLAIGDHFAPVRDEHWESLVPSSLDWHPPEGITMRPFYRQSSYTYAHAQTRWRLRLNGQASNVPELLKSGATAIGIDDASELNTGQLTTLLGELKGRDVPCFIENRHQPLKVLSKLREASDAANIRCSELHGAVSLDATAAPARHAELLTAAEGSNYRTIKIDLTAWHLAGANCVQEMAAAMSLLTHCIAHLGPKRVSNRIYFVVPVGTRYLMQIARLRALRHLANLVWGAFGISNTSTYICGKPSLRHWTLLDPDTHLVRVTLQCMAAAVGGCNVIEVDGGVAGRIPLIMEHEAAIAHTLDPAAGAWYLEVLTDKLARDAWKMFQEMEAQGGYFSAQDWLDEQIEASADKLSMRVRCGQQPFIGVNRYCDATKPVNTKAHATGRLAAPFEALRRQVNDFQAPPRICLLPGSSNARSWIKLALECAGLTTQDTASDAQVTVAFSIAQAETAAAHMVLVLDELPEQSLKWPILLSGGDMVDAAEQIIGLINQ